MLRGNVQTVPTGEKATEFRRCYGCESYFREAALKHANVAEGIRQLEFSTYLTGDITLADPKRITLGQGAGRQR